MIPKLSQEEKQFLRGILEKRRPDLSEFLDDSAKEDLAPADAEAIREALVAELCETGLDEDDEPNQRGLLIESLIGRLRPF
jgi:hypothetical protein